MAELRLKHRAPPHPKKTVCPAVTYSFTNSLVVALQASLLVLAIANPPKQRCQHCPQGCANNDAGNSTCKTETSRHSTT